MRVITTDLDEQHLETGALAARAHRRAVRARVGGVVDRDLPGVGIEEAECGTGDAGRARRGDGAMTAGIGAGEVGVESAERRGSSVAEQLIRNEPPASPDSTQHDVTPGNQTQQP